MAFLFSSVIFFSPVNNVPSKSSAISLINYKTPLSISAFIIRSLYVSSILYHKTHHFVLKKIRGSTHLPPLISYFASSNSSKSSNLTEASFETPDSCIVTPYNTSASSIVPRRCVITMNCVRFVNSFK